MTPGRRVILFAALGVLVGTYYAWSNSLWNASTWWDVAWISLALVPAVFAFVYLALPLRTWRWALPVGLVLVLVTWGLEEAGLDAVANFAKLAAATLLGFWFISQFFIGAGSGVAWMAHVGGFAFGVLVAALLRSRLRPPPEMAWRY